MASAAAGPFPGPLALGHTLLRPQGDACTGPSAGQLRDRAGAPPPDTYMHVLPSPSKERPSSGWRGFCARLGEGPTRLSSTGRVLLRVTRVWEPGAWRPQSSHVVRRPPLPALTVTPCCPQVNIDHFTKDLTVKSLLEPSPSTFDVAQKRIHALMEKDSLPRFVRSEFYQELVK